MSTWNEMRTRRGPGSPSGRFGRSLTLCLALALAGSLSACEDEAASRAGGGGTDAGTITTDTGGTGATDGGGGGGGTSDTGNGCADGLRWSGGSCVDIDECAEGGHDCDANATCTNTPGAFTCKCKSGFGGDGKTCVEGACDPGYKKSGSGCADINECSEGLHDCHANASCTNLTGSYSCACKSGYTGDGKTCAEIPCDPGFKKSGTICVDINECSEGLHDCDVNGTCTNSTGSFSCKCKTGYTGDGKTCAEIPCDPGFKKSGTICVDINECTEGLHDCDPNGSCSNMTGSFTCKCKSGYEGDGKSCTEIPCAPGYKKSGSGCVDIHECNEGLHDCDPNASCSNSTGSYSCKCKTGYEGDGKSCADIDECATGTHTCDATTFCKNTVGAFTCDCAPGYSKAGSKCFDINECLDGTDDCVAWCQNVPGSFNCMSTVADETSPYYTKTCDPDFSFHQYNWKGTPPNETYEYQTKLIADCRCGNNRMPVPLGGLAICQNPLELPMSYGFGAGPTIRELPNAGILGGTFDPETRLMYVGIEWQGTFYEDQGAILAIDADSGDRAIISGQWLDPANGYATYGESDPTDKTFWTDDIIGGPAYKNPLGRVYHVRLGQDGYLYAFTGDKDNYAHIVRVDIATGNRKVMWTEKRFLDPKNQNEPAHVQCPNGMKLEGSTTWAQIYDYGGFELDANGDYLVTVLQNGTTSNITPNGIIRIKKDGTDCQWVTRFGMGTNNEFYGQTIGTGPLAQFSFDALYLHQGFLYAVTSSNAIAFKIDPTTGNRTIVASDAVGTGALVGVDWLSWDPTRNIMWTGGTGAGTTIVSWDLVTNQRSSHIGLKVAKPKQFQTASGPLDTCCMIHLPGWVDTANGHLLVGFSKYAILRFEPESGNSVILSL